MAAHRLDARRVRDGSPRDAAREGGAFGDDGEDRPQGCAWDRTAHADGLVPAGSCQVAGRPGGAGAAGSAQTAAVEASGYRGEHPGYSAWVRPENGHGDT